MTNTFLCDEISEVKTSKSYFFLILLTNYCALVLSPQCQMIERVIKMNNANI